MLRPVTLFPQVLINVRLTDGSDWQGNAALEACQREVIQELGDGGRVLIRASGTEPVLRIMVEAQEASLAQDVAERLAQAARSADAPTPGRAGPWAG